MKNRGLLTALRGLAGTIYFIGCILDRLGGEIPDFRGQNECGSYIPTCSRAPARKCDHCHISSHGSCVSLEWMQLVLPTQAGSRRLHRAARGNPWKVAPAVLWALRVMIVTDSGRKLALDSAAIPNLPSGFGSLSLVGRLPCFCGSRVTDIRTAERYI